MSLKSTISVANLVWSPIAGNQGRLRAAESEIRTPPESRSETAKASIKHSDIPTPTQGYGSGSFYRLWHYLKPYDGGLGGTAFLTNKGFMVYFTTTAWLVVASVGLGSEITMGHTLMRFIASHEAGITIWHLSQLSFSLMLTVAFSAGSGFGLPFLAVGLWKFGFPETINCLVMFYTSPKTDLGLLARAVAHTLSLFPRCVPVPDLSGAVPTATLHLARYTRPNPLPISWRHPTSLSACRAVAYLIDGFGTLLHHLSTSFTLVGLMMHLFPRDRALTAGCIVPIMQHMFILVKYHAHTTYLILETSLEFWFQWEVIWNIPAFESEFGLEITRIGRGMAMTMLFAHWLYLLGSVVHMLDDKFNKDDDDDNEESSDMSREARRIRKQNTVQMMLTASEKVEGRQPRFSRIARSLSRAGSTMNGAAEAANRAVAAAAAQAAAASDMGAAAMSTASDMGAAAMSTTGHKMESMKNMAAHAAADTAHLAADMEHRVAHMAADTAHRAADMEHRVAHMAADTAHRAVDIEHRVAHMAADTAHRATDTAHKVADMEQRVSHRSKMELSRRVACS